MSFYVLIVIKTPLPFFQHSYVRASLIFPQSTTNKMQLFTIYLFPQDAVHVSDGFFVHHHELKTAHTASGICQTSTATCRYPSWLAACSSNGLKHVEGLTEINKLRKFATCWLYSDNHYHLHEAESVAVNMHYFLFLDALRQG